MDINTMEHSYFVNFHETFLLNILIVNHSLFPRPLLVLTFKFDLLPEIRNSRNFVWEFRWETVVKCKSGGRRLISDINLFLLWNGSGVIKCLCKWQRRMWYIKVYKQFKIAIFGDKCKWRMSWCKIFIKKLFNRNCQKNILETINWFKNKIESNRN